MKEEAALGVYLSRMAEHVPAYPGDYPVPHRINQDEVTAPIFYDPDRDCFEFRLMQRRREGKRYAKLLISRALLRDDPATAAKLLLFQGRKTLAQ